MHILRLLESFASTYNWKVNKDCKSTMGPWPETEKLLYNVSNMETIQQLLNYCCVYIVHPANNLFSITKCKQQ